LEGPAIEDVGIFCDQLVYFTAVWYIFSFWYIFPKVWFVVPGKIWQPCFCGRECEYEDAFLHLYQGDAMILSKICQNVCQKFANTFAKNLPKRLPKICQKNCPTRFCQN
jgi:hypothetical protein